jgi:hypothetical protein
VNQETETHLKLISILIITYLISFNSLADDFIEGKTELGTSFKISKIEWPITFRCKHYGGTNAGKFMFSIRKKKSEPLGLENAWLIFPDYTAYAGVLYRNGLDWRFDWTDRNTERKFTFMIKGGSDGFYYDWSLVGDNGTMSISRTATCE